MAHAKKVLWQYETLKALLFLQITMASEGFFLN